MNPFLTAVLFSLLPIAGNLLGAAIAEVAPVSDRSLSYALHAAAGVVLGVVGIELMPEALATEQPALPIAAFVAGGAFFIGIDAVTDAVADRFGGDDATSPWLIYLGVSVDLFSDGIMIGAGTVVASSLGLLLAIGQTPADLPEGFAVAATFRARGVPRRTRLLMSLAFAVPVLVGVTLGYFAVRDASDVVRFSLLAFTAGVLTTVVVEEIVPESHAGTHPRFAAMALVGGFALFAALSVTLA